MNIGGVHILVGLFFVVVCSGLSAFLIKTVYWLWMKSRFAIYWLKLRAFNVKERKAKQANSGITIDEKQRPLPPKGKAWNARFFISLCVVFLSLNLGLYTSERIKYLGNGNLHYKAKEYWVAGQVVAKTRKGLGLVLHPENPILVPYTLLHKSIYQIGKRYLPQDDGEKSVWYGAWFLYPYAQRIKLPYGVSTRRPSSEMAELIESFYNTMKNIQVSEIGDKDIYRKSLYDFPYLATYYSAYKSFSLGKLNRGGVKIRTNNYHSGRLLEVLKWLDQVNFGWGNEELREHIWNNNKYLASIMQLTTLELLQDISLSLPTRGTFSCDHPVISRMEEEYQKIMSADPSVNSLLNLGKRSYGAKAYRTFVLSARGSVGNYIIADVCKKEMPQEQYLFFSKKSLMGEGLDRFYIRSSVESVFGEELRPLMLYFYETKHSELFGGEAMEMYSSWQKVKGEQGGGFTHQEQDDHERILQGIDEMCLDRLLYGTRISDSAYCNLLLDRYLDLLDLDNSKNMSLPVLQREKAVEILDISYQDCEKKRDEINKVKRKFEQQLM